MLSSRTYLSYTMVSPVIFRRFSEIMMAVTQTVEVTVKSDESKSAVKSGLAKGAGLFALGARVI